jgi:hypothetical protein
MWNGTAATLKPKPIRTSAAPMVRSRPEVSFEAEPKIAARFVEPVAPKMRTIP